MRVKVLITLRVRKDKMNYERIPKNVVYEDQNIPEVVLEEVKKGRRTVAVLDWSGYERLISQESEEEETKKVKKRVKK